MIVVRSYKDKFKVSFDAFLQKKECLINANEMANIFDKKATNFLRLDSTKETILALEIKFGNKKFDEKNGFQVSDMRLENGESESKISENIVKVIHGGRNNGTWMHEILAIEFAMWLDVDFKIWILETIKEILFGFARQRTLSLQQSIIIKKEMDTLTQKTEPTGADFLRYMALQKDLDAEISGRRKITKAESNQIQLVLFDNTELN